MTDSSYRGIGPSGGRVGTSNVFALQPTTFPCTTMQIRMHCVRIRPSSLPSPEPKRGSGQIVVAPGKEAQAKSL